MSARVTRRQLLTGATALLLMPKLPLRAAAQIALDPITVTATPINLCCDLSSGTLGPATGQQFHQILMFLVAQERARQEALRQQQLLAQQPIVNFMIVPEEPPPAPPESEPTTIFLPSDEDFFWGGNEAYIQQRLEERGLNTAEALTAIYALRATFNLAKALVPVGKEGIALVAAGLAAGTVGLSIEAIGTGLAVGFVSLAMVGILALAVYVTVRYVLPEVNQQIAVFGQTLWSYDVDVQSQPLGAAVEAATKAITKESTPDVGWSNEQWTEWYMQQDNPYGAIP